MKKALTLLSLVFVTMSFSQKAKDLTNWNISLSQPEFKAGDEIEIIIAVDIADHWHMYSSDFDPNCGPLPTELTFTSNDTYTLVGELQAIDSHKKFDEIFECDITEFSKKGLFKQKIKVLKKELHLVMNGSYQVCQDDGMCLMGRVKINDNITPSTSTQNITLIKE